MILDATPVADGGPFSAAALTFYAAITVAVITAIVAPFVQGRLAREAEERKAERDAREKRADEDHETTAWLRGQVQSLQERVEKQGRTADQLKGQVTALQTRLRERDSDDAARDGRIAQLEAALVAGGIPVPPPAPDYARLIAREERARRGHD